jgi:hypothetical protein
MILFFCGRYKNDKTCLAKIRIFRIKIYANSIIGEHILIGRWQVSNQNLGTLGKPRRSDFSCLWLIFSFDSVRHYEIVQVLGHFFKLLVLIQLFGMALFRQLLLLKLVIVVIFH